MANTYSQITIHLIFAVKNRDYLLQSDFRDEIFMYISSIFKNLNQKLICINGIPNHIHILFGLNPDSSISNVVRDVKRFSTKFINEKRYLKGKFAWQEGYAAFSYSRSQRDKVINYINNQEKNHKVKTFKEEYIKLLEKFEIEYKSEYLFNWLESK